MFKVRSDTSHLAGARANSLGKTRTWSSSTRLHRARNGFEEVKLSDLSSYHSIQRKREGRRERERRREGGRQAGRWVGGAKVVHVKR